MNDEKYQIEEFDFPNTKEEQIQWVKELANNQEAILFFKKRASNYHVTVIELQKLLFRQKGVCALCGDKLYFNETTHVDHIIPKKLGGENNIKNYQLTCAKCNYAKRDIPTKDFIIMCIKIQTKNKYKLSKIETLKIVNKSYKYEDLEVRKEWINQYKEELENNNGKII